MARHLAAVSRALHRAVGEAWPDLARHFPCRLYVVGGLDSGYSIVDTVERFDPLVGRWEVLPSLSAPRAGTTAAVLAGRLYVLGGEACGRALRDAQRFDSWVGFWEQLPTMCAGRIRAGVTACGGHLYVLGGLDGARPLRSAERYDPSSRSWQLLPPLCKPRYACAATARHGFVYAFAGELTESPYASIERYSTEAREWIMLPAVRAPCCSAAVVISEDTVFNLGGLGLSGQALKDAEQLRITRILEGDLQDEGLNWEPLPQMPTARHLASAAAFNGGVCVVGGKGASFEAVANVEYFDSLTHTWEMLPPLRSPRLRAAVVGGLM